MYILHSSVSQYDTGVIVLDDTAHLLTSADIFARQDCFAALHAKANESPLPVNGSRLPVSELCMVVETFGYRGDMTRADEGGDCSSSHARKMLAAGHGAGILGGEADPA